MLRLLRAADCPEELPLEPVAAAQQGSKESPLQPAAATQQSSVAAPSHPRGHAAASRHGGDGTLAQAAGWAHTPGRCAGAAYSAPSRSMPAALARAVSFAGLLTGCDA